MSGNDKGSSRKGGGELTCILSKLIIRYLVSVHHSRVYFLEREKCVGEEGRERERVGRKSGREEG